MTRFVLAAKGRLFDDGVVSVAADFQLFAPCAREDVMDVDGLVEIACLVEGLSRGSPARLLS